MMMVIFFIIIDFMHFLGKSKMIERGRLSGSSKEFVVTFNFDEKL